MVQIEKEELQKMLDQAAQVGAMHALIDIGLADEDAPHDLKELRQLLCTFRAAKKTALHSIVRRVTDFLFIALAIGVAVKLGFWGGAK